jgi:hypothetical protein
MVAPRRYLGVIPLVAVLAAACASTPVSPNALPLDLQVRNSGLDGGFVWLGSANEPGRSRWHAFGMAEFFCVTCPSAFQGSVEGYDVAILDESCGLRFAERTLGGQLIVEIDPGPTIRISPAQPLGDWLPGDSPPLEATRVPCPPPVIGSSD